MNVKFEIINFNLGSNQVKILKFDIPEAAR